MADNTTSGKCQYYCEKSKSCTIGYCKAHNLCTDRSCLTNGKIDDVFRERNVTNYAFGKDFEG